MGRYKVNGKMVELWEDPPTAGDVKRATGSPRGDWVMATLPGGQVVKVPDHKQLPADVKELAVVIPYSYGCRS